MWDFEHDDVEPHIITVAKGIASAMPAIGDVRVSV
jgi:4-aminobutyrate aminotransferase-like enzyme